VCNAGFRESGLIKIEINAEVFNLTRPGYSDPLARAKIDAIWLAKTQAIVTDLPTASELGLLRLAIFLGGVVRGLAIASFSV
jgi:hypothetical protein